VRLRDARGGNTPAFSDAALLSLRRLRKRRDDQPHLIKFGSQRFRHIRYFVRWDEVIQLGCRLHPDASQPDERGALVSILCIFRPLQTVHSEKSIVEWCCHGKAPCRRQAGALALSVTSASVRITADAARLGAWR
jgi:hypothetical protein